MSLKKPNVKDLLEFLRQSYSLTGPEDQELQFRCPFCQKEDHLYYNLSKQVFSCKKCGEVGQTDRLIQGILWNVVTESEEGFEGYEYWKGRGIQEPKNYHLGYYHALQRYTIPYFSQDGELQNIAFRASKEGQEPRYLRLPGVPSRPYIIGLSSTGPVVVTEGEVDAITLSQSLPEWGVIGLPGGATVLDSLGGLIYGRNIVVAVYDRDSVGQRAGTKIRSLFPRIHLLEPGPGTAKDVNEAYLQMGKEGFTDWFKNAVEALPEVPVDSPKGPVAANVFVTMPDEQGSWLIKNLWMERSLGFIAGEPKSLKSYLSLVMGYSIATGRKFLGHEVLNPGPVILVQEEDSDYLIRGRLRTLVGEQPPDNLYFLTPGLTGRHVQLDSEESLEDLDRIVGQIKPRLLILDPLANLHSMESENDAASANRLMEGLRFMRDRHGCSILIVHHVGKVFEGSQQSGRPGRKLRGSSVFWAKAESLIAVERIGNLLTLKVENKAGADKSFDVEFNGTTFVPA